MRALPELLFGKAIDPPDWQAWRRPDLPEVIEAGRALGMIQPDGEIQFHLPRGGLCEDQIGINVSVPGSDRLPWADQVRVTADATHRALAARPPLPDLARQKSRGWDARLRPNGRGPSAWARLLWIAWLCVPRGDPCLAR
ncbi:MAG: hypothetical protein AAGC57_03215 [Pseudomonadota bacterium]